jgi:hypothetical protein
MIQRTSHLDLLAIARRVRDAVERDELDELHAELTRLRTALMDHLHAEQLQLDALSGPAEIIVIDGHRRLLELLGEVLFSSTGQDADEGCNCLVRAAEIEVGLRRQARLEDTLLRRHRTASGHRHLTDSAQQLGHMSSE